MPDYYPLIQAARRLKMRPWTLLGELKVYFRSAAAPPDVDREPMPEAANRSASDLPPYWPLIQAAAYLGVRPGELLRQPVVWREWALICESAETAAAAGPIMERA